MRTSDEIIDYLNQLRQQRGLSISALARQAGMAKSTISRYFNKQREFPINFAPIFAKIFNVSESELLGIANKPTKIDLMDDEITFTCQGKVIDQKDKMIILRLMNGKPSLE